MITAFRFPQDGQHPSSGFYSLCAHLPCHLIGDFDGYAIAQPCLLQMMANGLPCQARSPRYLFSAFALRMPERIQNSGANPLANYDRPVHPWHWIFRQPTVFSISPRSSLWGLVPMEAGRTDVPLPPEWCRQLSTLQRGGAANKGGLSILVSFRTILNCSSLIILFIKLLYTMFPNKQYRIGIPKM